MPTSEEIVQWLSNNNALCLGDLIESPPLENDNPDDFFRVDWDKLFPAKSQRGNNNFDWEFNDLDWDLSLDDLDQAFFGEISGALYLGAPQPNETDIQLSWDTLAWYQPMHFFGNKWGIFITEEGIRKIAVQVARFMPSGTRISPFLVKALIRAGFTALFLHEQFHHKIESFGIRLHVIEKTSRYLPYKRNVYRKTLGTDDNLEEALANADAFRMVKTAPYSRCLGKTVGNALQKYLEWHFPFDPPGYRMASHYLTKPRFNRAMNLLQSQVQDANLHPRGPHWDWELANRLHESFFKVDDGLPLKVVKPGLGVRPLLPVLPYRSISSREMIRVAENEGYTIINGAGKGSHVRMGKTGCRSLTIPGNCRDLSPGVTKSTLKVLGKTLNDIPSLLNP